MYRNVRMPVRVLYQSSCICIGLFYEAERQVYKFRDRMFRLEISRRERILDEAAERGIFLEESISSGSSAPSDTGK
ncbi:hypothetical protein Kpol_401p7 [Vanderwaltozyma polyspora DSM 70294]|uniref:Uncharacterized protein n=1 Tax=Vanderwaltozyma polyspora (strain ATCC 22028 / DSM 70294 / BCRC 21397 / CBS 2163 / NBRC 10782 / NRRL Y-8283 / UCD 57-17) TaxID=436907 RepID=A7TRA6_VANPO|nr:uncharacterized protein Kpol_401p7 [Vanderwaltozyma polyspora DSM 70294]EDO15202.1 hypothetical protein Kpol_401p7 [Vanderwaltozyma polyspora DSM 70294]